MNGTVLDGIITESPTPLNSPIINQDLPLTLFDIDTFVSDLAQTSEEKNRKARFYSNSINSYDIAHNCIREVLFKLQNQPVDNYQDVWLPIMMRAVLGNAVHDFIQTNSKQFTEVEVSIKVPSIRASVRPDALINNNVLCEIKTCTYDDYSKILRTRKPRDADFYQTVYNKYLIENHLAEAQAQQGTRSAPPKLSSYALTHIQLIYVAHDIISADCKSISESIQVAKEIKKLLNSKYNKFHYITTITLDLSKFDIKPYEDYIVGKMNAINYYMDNQTIPPIDNPYISSKSCHFCIYKKVCSQYGGPAGANK